MRKNVQIGIRSNFHLLLGLIIDKPHRVPDACVFAPYRCEPMHSIQSKGTLGMLDDLPVVGAYGHKDSLPGLHEDLRNGFAGFRDDRISERNHVILDGRTNEVVDDGMEAESLLHSETVERPSRRTHEERHVPSCPRTYTSSPQYR